MTLYTLVSETSQMKFPSNPSFQIEWRKTTQGKMDVTWHFLRWCRGFLLIGSDESWEMGAGLWGMNSRIEDLLSVVEHLHSCVAPNITAPRAVASYLHPSHSPEEYLTGMCVHAVQTWELCQEGNEWPYSRRSDVSAFLFHCQVLCMWLVCETETIK